MHAEDDGGTIGDDGVPSTVAGLPWWNGGGATTTEKPRSQAQVLAQAQLDNKDGIKPVLSNVQQLSTESGYDESGESGQQIKQGAPSSIAPPPPPGEYILPHVQLELGQSLTAYPYADPYFGGIVADYRSRVMFHPHILGIQQARMPLPSEMVEEEPVYVNAKQYHGILRRRQIRAKAESENKLVKSRKVIIYLGSFCMFYQSK
ncbi:hypothetical protein O6H91_Y492300 [Diphasiastrum complanatum]|nr:hypothetical protein O6H91_Y492300 [Diphasiastrum complanatum]